MEKMFHNFCRGHVLGGPVLQQSTSEVFEIPVVINFEFSRVLFSLVLESASIGIIRGKALTELELKCPRWCSQGDTD